MTDATITLTEEQADLARELVAEGRFPSIEAVLAHGLDLVRAEAGEVDDAFASDEDQAMLKALLEKRAKGPFVTITEFRSEIETMMEEESAALREEYGA